MNEDEKRFSEWMSKFGWNLNEDGGSTRSELMVEFVQSLIDEGQLRINHTSHVVEVDDNLWLYLPKGIRYEMVFHLSNEFRKYEVGENFSDLLSRKSLHKGRLRIVSILDGKIILKYNPKSNNRKIIEYYIGSTNNSMGV